MNPYYIPIENLSFTDLIDSINEIALDIQKDIIQYGLLSTSINHKDSKKIVYHHLIKRLCEIHVQHNFQRIYFIYSSHRLSFTKLNTIFIDTAADIKLFLEEFIKTCITTIGIIIYEFPGGAKKFYEEYNSGSASAISKGWTLRSCKSDKKKQQKFFQKYGLKYLYENHFKNINYLILTT
jgi:hypothetical protein